MADTTNTTSTTTNADEGKSSFGIGSAIFAVILAILIFLLLTSMVSHRFFRGGHPHRVMMTAPQNANPAEFC